MPIQYARSLTSPVRSARADLHLGMALAGVAGAINAGGFLAVQQYTSHMTGIVSSMADNLALGATELVAGGVAALLSFIAGAACTAVMVNFARRRRLHSQYALPLLLEAGLLLVFGLLGTRLAVMTGLFVPATVMLLCFMMGLQNALITKISRAEIRTTHVTGIVTDLGIEVGKMAYWNRSGDARGHPVRANRERIGTLSLLLGCFFAGGVAGAVGFNQVGCLSTVPLAVVLVLLTIIPATDDLRNRGGGNRPD